MKAALLISGYLRTVKNNLESIKKNVIDCFETCDVYMHITKNEKQEDKYFNPMTSEDVDSIKNFLSPRFLVEEFNFCTGRHKKENDLINSWLKYYKLYAVMSTNESIEGDYDVVIKYRPDVNILERVPYEICKNSVNTVFIPKDSKVDASKLDHSNDPHICDAFAFGASPAMKSYFPDFEKIESTIREHGSVPENFLYWHLTKNSVDYKLVDIEYNILLSSCNVFAIVGDSGSGKSTLANLLKKSFSDSFLLECDRYHKWERNDEMWKKFTHLNPESNFLSKMRSDIFDLKLGKHVYQVDYDHKTGKFTEKEIIPSKNNLIVCGLHSLYIEDDKTYNASIFMDTDINLRKKWKIKRDTQKRGYSVEKVLKQIEERQEDYKNFIEPQKKSADIIVNFYTNNNFSIQSLNDEDEVGLKIWIARRNSFEKAVSGLKNVIGQEYQYIENESWRGIHFDVCGSSTYNEQKISEFYNCIVSVALNTEKEE
jgi:uridine kinase